jgi:hypothetical protein
VIDAAIGTGVSDYEVGRKFGIERVSVGRHRRRHLIKPARDKLAILAKDSEERRQRQELAQAAGADEPSIDDLVQASLGTRAMLAELGEIKGMLKRVAAKAEEAGSPTGVAAIAGQQIRSMEFGARLGGHRNFLPASTVPQASDKAVVKIEMIFPNAGIREEIALSVRPIIDGEKTDPAAADAMDLPQPHPNRRIKPDEKPASTYWNFDQLPRE